MSTMKLPLVGCAAPHGFHADPHGNGSPGLWMWSTDPERAKWLVPWSNGNVYANRQLRSTLPSGKRWLILLPER